MAHRVDPLRIRARAHALIGIAVFLSLLVATVVEAYHSHEGEAESAAECSACQLGKTPSHATGSSAPGLTAPSQFWVPSIVGHRSAPKAIHFAPHRSRAPPLSVSL